MTFLDLQPILQRVFPDESNFDINITKGEVLSWDSIGHLNLIVEIEDELGVSFSKEEIEKINSFQDLLDLINMKHS